MNEETHVTYLSYTGYEKHKDPPTQVFCPSRTAVAEKWWCDAGQDVETKSLVSTSNSFNISEIVLMSENSKLSKII